MQLFIVDIRMRDLHFLYLFEFIYAYALAGVSVCVYVNMSCRQIHVVLIRLYSII